MEFDTRPGNSPYVQEFVLPPAVQVLLQQPVRQRLRSLRRRKKRRRKKRTVIIRTVDVGARARTRSWKPSI